MTATTSMTPGLYGTTLAYSKRASSRSVVGRGVFALLLVVSVAPRPSFGMIVHHTDADREFAYDAHPPASGTPVTALAAARSRGWTVVDMNNHWTRVFKN